METNGKQCEVRQKEKCDDYSIKVKVVHSFIGHK